MKKESFDYYISLFFSIILLFLSMHIIKLTPTMNFKSENDITLTVLSIRNDDLY